MGNETQSHLSEQEFKGLVRNHFLTDNFTSTPDKCEIMGLRRTSAWLGLRKKTIDVVAATITTEIPGRKLYGGKSEDIGVRMKLGFSNSFQRAETFAQKYEEKTGKKATVYR